MHNADNLLELANELRQEFIRPKGISVYIHTLLEAANGSQAMHNDQKRKYVFDKMNKIELQLRDDGFIRANRLIHHVKTNHCMADNDNSIVIAPDGHIGKCEHYTEDHFIGHIMNQKWNSQMKEYFRETHDEIDACTTCFKYPNCIWLNLCQNKITCTQEYRDHDMANLRYSILKAYQETHINIQ